MVEQLENGDPVYDRCWYWTGEARMELHGPLTGRNEERCSAQQRQQPQQRHSSSSSSSSTGKARQVGRLNIQLYASLNAWLGRVHKHPPIKALHWHNCRCTLYMQWRGRYMYTVPLSITPGTEWWLWRDSGKWMVHKVFLIHGWLTIALLSLPMVVVNRTQSSGEYYIHIP